MGHQHELIDRLVVATEEKDVLWVLVMLEQMKESGCLEQAINASHSWKRYSALQAISRLSSLSTLHRFIAQLLLFNGATSTETGQNIELAELAKSWDGSGRNEAQDAQHVLSLELTEAADWIDSNLPLPPNPQSLTGGGPLPSSPSLSPLPALTPTASKPSANAPLVASPPCASPDFPRATPPSTFGSTDEAPVPSSSSSPIESLQYSTTTRQTASPSEPYPSSGFLPCTFPPRSPTHRSSSATLHIASLPLHYSVPEVLTLFSDINVRTESIQIIPNDPSRVFGFVVIQACDVDYCIRLLHDKIVEGQQIYCELARSLESARRSSVRPPSHQSLALRSLPQLANNLRIPQYEPLYLNHSHSLSSSSIVDDLHKSRKRSRSSSTRHEEEEEKSGTEIEEGECLDVTTFHVAGLPPHYDRAELEKLFANLGVRIYNVDLGHKRRNHFALLDVEVSQVRDVLKVFQDGVDIQGYWVNCYVSKLPRPPRFRRSPPQSARPEGSSRSAPSLITLYVTGFPPRFAESRLPPLFTEIGVSPQAIRYQPRGSTGLRPFAFVDMQLHEADHCNRYLDGQFVEGYRIHCHVSKPDIVRSRNLPPLPSVSRPAAPHLHSPLTTVSSSSSPDPRTSSLSSDCFAPRVKRTKSWWEEGFKSFAQ